MFPSYKRSGLTTDSLVQYGKAGSALLLGISESTNTPYLRAISAMSSLILDTIAQVRSNKEEALRLAASAYAIIYAIINICDNDAEPPPSIVRSIGQFFDTLQKILTYVRTQLGRGLVKRVFRRMEDAALLIECKAGLEHATAVFGVQSQLTTAVLMSEEARAAQARHDQLLAALADSGSIETQSMRSSSNSISMLPGSPKIFYGREAELHHICTHLISKPPARIAILGPGGIGKSSLALAVLYSPEIIEMFPNRYFVSCDSARSEADLLSLLGAYFDLEGRRAKPILRHFSSLKGPSLIVLDNLETCWEPEGSRVAVEEFLSMMADVKQLGIIVTMRGEERPSRVKWTRPFLPVLSPLTSAAARATFRDISDNSADDDDAVDELLEYTGNLPLAVTLMANLVAFEGMEAVIEQWKAEGTSILSDGADRRNNLNRSTAISLSSPRVVATPGAEILLSLLAMLPDGMSIATLNETGLSIPNLPKCIAALRRTALIYVSDTDQRLNTLVPIREYMRAHSSPPKALLQTLRDYFYNLLHLFADVDQPPPGGSVRKVTSNLGNIRSILEYFAHQGGDESRDAIRGIIQLANFTHHSGYGTLDLLRSVRPLAKGLGDEGLYGECLHTLAKSPEEPELEPLLMEAICCVEAVHDLSAQAMAYMYMSAYHVRVGALTLAMETARTALELAVQAQNPKLEALALVRVSTIEYHQGNLTLALKHAREAADIAREGSALVQEISSLRQQAYYLTASENYKEAGDACNTAASLVTALGLDTSSSLYRGIIMVQADIYLRRTEYANARRINEPLATARNTRGEPLRIKAYAMYNIALIDIATGARDHPAILNDIAAAQHIFLNVADRNAANCCNIVSTEVYFLEGDYEKASKICLDILAVPELSGDARSMCFQRLGDIAYVQKNFFSALHHYILKLIICHKHEDMCGRTDALRCIGDIFLAHGKVDAALHSWAVALGGFKSMDIHRGRAECLLRIGDVYMARGQDQRAREQWRDARTFFELCSQTRQVEQCDERLF
ncbi:hypothetical protein C8J57DRAFT_1137502 [Mycena rebaudengoi]|nr:hypothetical protein C8J57DRAFT_1137502 [Mycena rebaudengoi]